MLKIRTDYPRLQGSAMEIHVDDYKMIINGTEFHLGDIKERKDFRAFCRYIFPLSNYRGLDNQAYEIVKIGDEEKIFYKPVALQTPFERYSNSFNTKHSEFPQYSHLNCPISMVFYPETKTFKDALMTVTRQGEFVPLKITTTDKDGNIIDYKPAYEGPLPTNEHLIPKCELKADKSKVPSNGTVINFTYKDRNAKSVKCDFTATVKVNKGYITHNEFEVKASKGSFKFFPLGLSKGEKVLVQVGIGKYSDIVNMELEVEQGTTLG